MGLKSSKASKPNPIDEIKDNLIPISSSPRMKAIIHRALDSNKPFKCQMLIKKNSFAHKIEFSDKKTRRQAKTILTRNAKYMKRLKAPMHSLDPSLNFVKYLKGLRYLNISKNYQDRLRLYAHGPLKTLFLLRMFVKMLLRGGFVLTSFKSDITIFGMAFSSRRLHKLRNAYVHTTDGFKEVEDILYSKNKFREVMASSSSDNNAQSKELRHLFVDFTSSNKDQEAFFAIFQNMCSMKIFKSLQVLASFPTFTKDSIEVLGPVKNFYNIVILSLDLSFGYNKHDGHIFANLGQFPHLKSLTLKIISIPDLDFTDIGSFIALHENLITLKFSSSLIYREHYNPIWKAIYNRTNLEILSLKRIPSSYDCLNWSFSYEDIFDLIQSLPSLKKVNIKFVSSPLDISEMSSLPKFLLNCNVLEKAKIYLKTKIYLSKSYDFNEEFYEDFNRLAKKLKEFKILLDSFPVNVTNKLSCIIAQYGGNKASHSCKEFDDSSVQRREL